MVSENKGSADDIPAKMRCAECNKVVKFPKSKIGKTAKCPGCSAQLNLVDQSVRQVQAPKPVKPAELVAKRSEPKAPTPVRNEVASAEVVPALPVEDSRLSRFVSDGQSPKVVAKLLGRVDEVCTETESPEYIAVQHLPGVMSPDAIVLTNRRVIIFRSKALGRMNMVDVSWLDVANIHVSEGIVGATLSVSGLNGHTEKIDHLPKKQARCVYRVGQQREEHVREIRRERKMEEDRNAAGNVVVNTAVAAPVAAAQPESNDLASRLTQLKSMLEAGLIDQTEFDDKKAEILKSL